MSCWINDRNQELYHFWLQVQTNLPKLVEEVKQIKDQTKDGRILFESLKAIDVNSLNPLERAVRFFVLNRITFSGTIESGGYSNASFKSRFTDSSIQRLAVLDGCFINTRVTNFDYSDLLTEHREDVFIFLRIPLILVRQNLSFNGKKR